MKPTLPFLEVMMLRSCNLSCHGCTTFSDLKHQGDYSDWETNRQWLINWSQRLNIEAIGLMGGEPLIHPRIRDWLSGIRETLPNAQIRFVTNGLLLEKHIDIIDMLYELGHSVLKISVHVEDDRINRIVKYIMNRFDWRPVTEFNINRWSTDNEFKFQINCPERFFKTFRGPYNDMLPHDNDPREAFALCVQKRCPLLFNGNLFKCGTAALTPHMLEKQKNTHMDLWKNYITNGLSSDCSDHELEQFINNFGKPHSICRQCPSENDLESIIDHRKNVEYK
jgi:hypothetical protein